MVVNIEDAGFEIRDQIQWIYGSGFPKSHNIGKAVDKLEGNDREDLGRNPAARPCSDSGDYETNTKWKTPPRPNITKGTSPYEGWGTALKPANEPICVARKPLSEKSVAENVLKWGTGGINIDGCRVGLQDGEDTSRSITKLKNEPVGFLGTGFAKVGYGTGTSDDKWQEGRFPANIILECICDEVIKGEKGEIKKTNRNRTLGDTCYGDFKDQSVDGIDNYNDKGDTHTDPNCPCHLLDEQSGFLKSGEFSRKETNTNTIQPGGWKTGNRSEKNWQSTSGGASRFFYQAKVSKAERNMGLDGFEDKIIEGRDEGQDERNVAYKPRPVSQKNTHPTVKPINLMAYLCRLITPEGGIVLDPFMGSGSTGVAAQLEGFKFLGMEMDPEYFKIADTRIENYEKYNKFKK
jgi:site-specific DNA-methyltransferase (adenine-specific)